MIQNLTLLGGAVSLAIKTLTAGDIPGGPVVKTPPSNAGGVGSIPGRGTKVIHVVKCSQEKEKRW